LLAFASICHRPALKIFLDKVGDKVGQYLANARKKDWRVGPRGAVGQWCSACKRALLIDHTVEVSVECMECGSLF